MHQALSTNEVRQKFLDFFASKGHVIVPSAPIVPENDPTTLFTGSGMQPMVPYLLGQPHPLGKRLADSQKCLRVQDIEDVGDNRHTTFFEMLGNWSLGDFFKKEQIAWMFEFLTKELGLDPTRLYVTVFAGNKELGITRDDEAITYWQEAFTTVGIEAKALDHADIEGMRDGRIFTYDEKKNWWSRSGVPANMPVGEPGGPDTEMFWDFGVEKQLHEQSAFKDEPCHVNCDCGRFLEIGNNVFMQYLKTDSGFNPLPQRNVDFGGGLERLTAAVQDNPDVFMIDLFAKLREALETHTGKKYAANSETTRAFRIVMDHIRASAFLLGEEHPLEPGNTDQGYVLRRLIRRAVRSARLLGVKDIPLFLKTSLEAVFDEYQGFYTSLAKHRNRATEVLEVEVKKFLSTLDRGLQKIDQILQQGEDISGYQAFELFTSYGLPIEMILEVAKEKGATVDEVGFVEEMEKHKELSRTAAAGKFKGGLSDHSEMSVKYHTATHLLHQALHIVLGSHAMQKGSNITPERLRFDFSHPVKMTPEEIKKVEDLVNEQIAKDLVVTREEMTVEEAKQKGALGLFGSKYGDKVSVYSMGDFSCEICGGPHVEHTGTLGKFKITKEESAGSGVRRIKAVLE